MKAKKTAPKVTSKQLSEMWQKEVRSKNPDLRALLAIIGKMQNLQRQKLNGVR